MIQIESLTCDDINEAMQLVAAAGWNQTPGDWQRVIEYQPWGCFKATHENRLVGTVTSTSYGRELAWIGMMLVDVSMRRQGVGRKLMQAVISALQASGAKTIKLDATPMGRPLYEQLGFIAQFDFQRLRRAESIQSPGSLSFTAEQLVKHRRLDERAFGVDRWDWLQAVAKGSRCRVGSEGFGMLRSGRVADYLGPVIAGSESAAREIVTELVRSSSSIIFWDQPQSSKSIGQWALELGFEPVRDLTRMTLGGDTTEPNVSLQYAICDPACG